MTDVAIRRAEAADVPALLQIYNHYVIHTHITFDIEPRTLEQRHAWFGMFGSAGRHQCFVAATPGGVIGWACSQPFKDRAAYDTSVETSVYLAPGSRGRGIGRRLYQRLFEQLGPEDVHRAYGAISQPNGSSVGLHRAMGFAPVGVYCEVGRKFDRFWDVAIYERVMDRKSPSNPPMPLI